VVLDRGEYALGRVVNITVVDTENLPLILSCGDLREDCNYNFYLSDYVLDTLHVYPHRLRPPGKAVRHLYTSSHKYLSFGYASVRVINHV